MTLEELRRKCDEHSSMAPFPWRFTRRFGWPRLECANGNTIVEPFNGDSLSGSDEDLEFLALAASSLPGLLSQVDYLQKSYDSALARLQVALDRVAKLEASLVRAATGQGGGA